MCLSQSLGKPRSLSNSYRKNVRFASVVSEIPVLQPLASVAEAVEAVSDLGEAVAGDAASAAAATDSPVRFLVQRPRTRSLELAIVSGELPAPVFTVPVSAAPVPGPGATSSTSQSVKRTSKM